MDIVSVPMADLDTDRKKMTQGAGFDTIAYSILTVL